MSKRLLFALLAVTLVAGTAAAGLTPQPSNLVELVPSSAQILIPAAGAAQGANGTFFRSDINVINLAGHDQRVNFRWMPQGGGSNVSVDVTIPAHSGVASEDFVTNVLNQQGIGSIVVSSVDENGQLDLTGGLTVTSRIWTPQPGSASGTTSQSFNTLSLTTLSGNTANSASIFGIRRDSRYRANVGIVNLSLLLTHTYQVTVVTPGTGNAPTADVYTVTVPPIAMQQIALNAGTAPVSQIIVQRLTTGSGLWTAYGSSVDNVTGDSWSELATAAPVPPTTP